MNNRVKNNENTSYETGVFEKNSKIKAFTIGPALAKIKSAVTEENYVFTEKDINVNYVEFYERDPIITKKVYSCGIIMNKNNKETYDKEFIIYETEKFNKKIPSDDILLYRDNKLSYLDYIFCNEGEFIDTEETSIVSFSNNIFTEEDYYLQDFINLVIERRIQNNGIITRKEVNAMADIYIETLTKENNLTKRRIR